MLEVALALFSLSSGYPPISTVNVLPSDLAESGLFLHSSNTKFTRWIKKKRMNTVDVVVLTAQCKRYEN